jgi:hypothetical protein
LIPARAKAQLTDRRREKFRPDGHPAARAQVYVDFR